MPRPMNSSIHSSLIATDSPCKLYILQIDAHNLFDISFDMLDEYMLPFPCSSSLFHFWLSFVRLVQCHRPFTLTFSPEQTSQKVTLTEIGSLDFRPSMAGMCMCVCVYLCLLSGIDKFGRMSSLITLNTHNLLHTLWRITRFRFYFYDIHITAHRISHHITHTTIQYKYIGRTKNGPIRTYKYGHTHTHKLTSANECSRFALASRPSPSGKKASLVFDTQHLTVECCHSVSRQWKRTTDGVWYVIHCLWKRNTNEMDFGANAHMERKKTKQQ